MFRYFYVLFIVLSPFELKENFSSDTYILSYLTPLQVF